MQRPDLTKADPEIIAYIEYLEKKAGAIRPARAQSGDEHQQVELSPERAVEMLPPERETNVNIITVTRSGQAKRTLRHLYTRQHRGGMGVFGMELEKSDAPVILSNAEENQGLLLFTNRARVFRAAMSQILSTPVLEKGHLIIERLSLETDENLVAILPEQAKGYVALASENGRVRCLRHHLFGEHMRAGTAFYNLAEFGPLASACWTPGDAELFLVTQQGIGIRFSEKSLSPQGDVGIRVSGDDRLVAVVSVYPDSGVFLVGADGRGAIRQMSGFAANKSPGGAGKIAFKSSKVTGAVAVEVNDDIFVISRQGKIIRFPANEVPLTEGVVQGVNCMTLRADETVAVLKSGPIYP